MNLSKITILQLAKNRLAWLSQRQEILAQNIANADTPKYRARDIEPFKFERMLRSSVTPVNVSRTQANHLSGHRSSVGEYAEEKTRKPFETAPSGNSVILEEQMAKINETSISHKLTIQLYKKHLRMVRTALGK